MIFGLPRLSLAPLVGERVKNAEYFIFEIPGCYSSAG